MLPACYATSKKWLQSNSNICKIFKVKFVGQIFSNISPSNIIKGWLFGWVLNLLKVPSSTYQEQTSLSLPILNDAKPPKKVLKPWHMSTHSRVLGKSYPMNTNMTWFRWFSKSLRSCALDKSSLSIGRVKMSYRYVWMVNYILTQDPSKNFGKLKH